MLIATFTKLSKAVEAPPLTVISAQVKTPLPFVCKNWLAFPSFVGSVRV